MAANYAVSIFTPYSVKSIFSCLTVQLTISIGTNAKVSYIQGISSTFAQFYDVSLTMTQTSASGA